MSKLAEDKAVDIYVLKRAFTSTHPGSEALVFKSYKIVRIVIRTVYQGG